MLMTGVGAVAAAIPVPEAGASPSRPAAPSGPGPYIFQDEFDGPAGSAPDGAKWHVARAREPMKDPTYWELPEHVGQYRDDRQNVFLDGNSNLVIRAAKDGPTFYSGRLTSNWRGGIGHTWEARVKLDCLTPGAWPAWWLGNDEMTIPVAKSTSSSGTATGVGPRPPPSTRSRTARSGRPKTSRSTADGTPGDASGTRPGSASGRTTPTVLSRTSPLPRTHCRIGRSTTPATPSIRS
jgi:hypothetical protein